MLAYAYVLAVFATIGVVTTFNATGKFIKERAYKMSRNRREEQMRKSGYAVLRDFYRRERKRQFMREVYEWGQNP